MNKEFFEEMGDLLLFPFRVLFSVFDTDNSIAMFIANILIISCSLSFILVSINVPVPILRIWEYILFALSALYSVRVLFKPAYEEIPAIYYYFSLLLFVIGCISLCSDKLLRLFQAA
ncbi:MAG: hypothetical protein IJ780_04610 [Neisseriaceae bacterium]|nr:hypothetical protein [Neisseriaceae bacterium]